MGQILKILTWRDFGPLRQCSRKFPSRIFTHFGRPAAQNRKKFRNLTHLVAPWSKRSNRNFGGRAAKMSKKSWRETFGFTGVNFRCELPSPGEKFGNLTNLVAPHERSQVLVAGWSKRPNRNCRPRGVQNG